MAARRTSSASRTPGRVRRWRGSSAPDNLKSRGAPMSADEAVTRTPPHAEDTFVAALRSAAQAARELPAALDSALDVLGEAVREAAGPHPPAPSSDNRGDRGPGLRGCRRGT